MRALLDVNVLIALLDAGHIHHRLAMAWLEDHIRFGWASCPITQNGCIRIMSQPAYPGTVSATLVAERLMEAATRPDHEFWSANVSLLDGNVFDWSLILGHRQVTDVYLLALAVRHGGRLVSFDRRINLGAVKGAASHHLLVLGC